MYLPALRRRSGALAGAAAIAVGGLLGLAPASQAAPAHSAAAPTATRAPATSGWLDQWGTFRCNSVNWFCLYYSQNAAGAGWGYPHADAYVRDLNNYRFPSNDGAGSGQVVGNNAASAENKSWCNVAIWSSIDFSGDSSWLSPWEGGNLTYLRNNERSIAVDDTSRCPGTGIG